MSLVFLIPALAAALFLAIHRWPWPWSDHRVLSSRAIAPGSRLVICEIDNGPDAYAYDFELRDKSGEPLILGTFSSDSYRAKASHIEEAPTDYVFYLDDRELYRTPKQQVLPAAAE